MINLYNPTNLPIHMTFKGTRYDIPAKSELLVSDEVAEHWQTNVHQFLQTRALPEIKTKKTVPVEPEKQSIT